MNVTTTARTENARSRAATARDIHVAFRFTMNEKVDAANNALLQAHKANVEARVAWDVANAAGDNGLDVSATADAARRNANRVVAVADMVAGLVSSAACGLYGVSFAGEVFIVESTTSGRASLDGVIYLTPTASGKTVEGPEVRDVLHFFESYDEAAGLAARVQSGLV